MTDNKFPEEGRTFESRLQFIKAIFQDLHPQFEIMKKCIEHKLGWQFKQYVEELERSIYNLQTENPMKVMKKM